MQREKTLLNQNKRNQYTMIQDNNYYHKRGITVKRCVCQCQELGLNPCNWSNLKTAFEILKTQYALRNY